MGALLIVTGLVPLPWARPTYPGRVAWIVEVLWRLGSRPVSSDLKVRAGRFTRQPFSPSAPLMIQVF
jgi:hypothetical protein